MNALNQQLMKDVYRQIKEHVYDWNLFLFLPFMIATNYVLSNRFITFRQINLN